MNGYDSIYNVDLTRAIKIQDLINNHLRKTLMSTRHLRSWSAKHKMSEDDFRQKTGRNIPYPYPTIFGQVPVLVIFVLKCPLVKELDYFLDL